MTKIYRLATVMSISAIVSIGFAQSAGVQLEWSNTLTTPSLALELRDLTSFFFGKDSSAAVCLWSPTNNTGYYAVSSRQGNGILTLEQSMGGGAADFLPFAISSMLPINADTIIPVVIGKQLSFARKVRFFGDDRQSNGADLVSGNLDFTYNPSIVTYDEPLSLGKYPYANYSASVVQAGVGGPRQLAILYAQRNHSNPLVGMIDTAIVPTSSVFSDNEILAAGVDTQAGTAQGGARASAYKINANGSVSLAFTKTRANTLVGNVFTSHTLMWASSSPSFNVLIDNIKVHNGNTDAFTYSHILTAYDAAGSQLWTAPARYGTIFQASVGSPYNTWVLGTNGPGQFLLSYGLNGVLRKSMSTKVTRVVAAESQGAYTADNEVDASGHRHIHFTRYNLKAQSIWTGTYATSATNDDTVKFLHWFSGKLHVAGNFVPQTGRPGVFCASYFQTN